MTTQPQPLLWLSDSRGIYIPRDFARSFADRAKSVDGVSAEDWAILEAGPDHEFYWETWDDVLSDAIITDENGIMYHVHQDGDCWLVPKGMEWNDEGYGWQWPADEPYEGDVA